MSDKKALWISAFFAFLGLFLAWVAGWLPVDG
jgi:hypothetical protein